mgnify:FL=1
MDRKEQEDIVQSCHRDPTSGHFGLKKTVARITERFMWPGVVKDVETLVRAKSLPCFFECFSYGNVILDQKV